MRSFPTEINEDYYYYKDSVITTIPKRGGFCFLSPGDIVWKSDSRVLRQLKEGRKLDYSVNAVIAKYLINRENETV